MPTSSYQTPFRISSEPSNSTVGSDDLLPYGGSDITAKARALLPYVQDEQRSEEHTSELQSQRVF
jgi:hypothetical protein